MMMLNHNGQACPFVAPQWILPDYKRGRGEKLPRVIKMQRAQTLKYQAEIK